MGQLVDMNVWNGDQLEELLRYVTTVPINIVEIGSYRGQSAAHFMSTGLVNRLYCVDPWLSGYDDGDLASHSDMDEVERDFDNRMAPFGDKIIKLKGTLIDAIGKLSDHIDLVYVDGCHKYESVRNDLILCRDVIKPSIAFSGHDISWGDVRRAVNDVLGVPDRVFTNTSWVKIVR